MLISVCFFGIRSGCFTSAACYFICPLRVSKKIKQQNHNMLPCLSRYSHATLYITSHPLSPPPPPPLLSQSFACCKYCKMHFDIIEIFFFFFGMSVPTNKHSAGFKGVCGGWKWLLWCLKKNNNKKALYAGVGGKKQQKLLCDERAERNEPVLLH